MPPVIPSDPAAPRGLLNPEARVAVHAVASRLLTRAFEAEPTLRERMRA